MLPQENHGPGFAIGCALLLVATLGCADSHVAAPGPGHFANVEGDGTVEIIWSIPEAQQPPLLDGAAEVLTRVALAELDVHVGSFLSEARVVYVGALSIDDVPLHEPIATWSTSSRLQLARVSFDDGAHQLDIHSGDAQPHMRIWQDALWEALADDDHATGDVGSAWLQLPTSTGAPVLGRCIACVTILRAEPVTAIAIDADALDSQAQVSMAPRVHGELRRVVASAFAPELLARVWTALGDPLEAARAGEFVELASGVWQRQHVGRTYLRCKEGGSRVVEYRTTWRLEAGDPTRSGIGDIDVTDAAECEAFDYGGGS